jgi:cytochrome bd ubiquinol oxidase subunit II
LIGLLALTTLTAHGATYIALKTSDPLSTRARKIASLFVLLTIVLVIPGTITTWMVQPQLHTNYFGHPWGFLFPAIALGGLIMMGFFNLQGRDGVSFSGSCAFIAGMLASAAFGIYPLVLPAVNRANSLTIQNAAASAYAQTVGLAWWCFAMLLALIYFFVTYRLFWGKVSLSSSEGY